MSNNTDRTIETVAAFEEKFALEVCMEVDDEGQSFVVLLGNNNRQVHVCDVADLDQYVDVANGHFDPTVFLPDALWHYWL